MANTTGAEPALYWNESIAAAEATNIFRKDWVCSVLAAETPNQDYYLAFSIAGEPIFCISDKSSNIKTYSNVCRHRMMQLLDGTGAGVQDTLTGNGGADIFVCSLSDAVTDATLADIISYFTNGTDLIGLEDLAWSDLTILDSGANAKIVNTGTSKVLFVLESFDHTLIKSTDFVATDFV